MFSALIDGWAVDRDSATLAIPGVNSKNKLQSYHLSGYQSSILTKGKYQQAEQNKQDNIAQTILVNAFAVQGSLGGSDGCSCYTLIKAYYTVVLRGNRIVGKDWDGQAFCMCYYRLIPNHNAKDGIGSASISA